VGVRLKSALNTDPMKETHRRGLESLGRDLVVDSVGWDLDVTRSALLQDIREHLVESFSPCSIGDWWDSIQQRLRYRQRFRHRREGSEGGRGVEGMVQESLVCLSSALVISLTYL